MPLGLDAEEMNTLRGDAQVADTAVRKLLMHYNGDLGNGEGGVKIYPVINSKEALEHQLPRIKYQFPNIGGNNKNLFILNVNALDKNFTGGANHYVGLVIEPTFPRYSVQYIDPLGGKINPAIRESINRFLAGGADITEYRDGLQYAEVRGKEDARTFVKGHNDYDSGPMLVYLMTKAAHDQELPALPDVGDKAATSKDIGRRLRRKFRNELAVPTNLAILSLADLKILSHSDPVVAKVAEKASASAANAVAVMEIDDSKDNITSSEERVAAGVPSSARTNAADWIPRDDPNPSSLIIRKSYNPDMVSRRLDSIARLITGMDTCAAVAFDGEKILYSNNSGKKNDISRRVFKLLSDIATQEMTVEDISRNKAFNDEMNAIAETSAQQMSEEKRRGKAQWKKTFQAILLKDIKKVVGSLAVDSPKQFPEKIIRAFKNPEGHEFVIGKTAISEGKSIRVHAEMAILDKVVGKDSIRVDDQDVRAGRKPFYIGLTMLCCKDCRNAVVAYNEVSAKGKSSGNIGIADDSLFQTVGVRGQHLQQYNNWVPPDFFEHRPAVAAKYQEIKERGQKYNPGGGKVFADDSNSEAEIDVVKRRKLVHIQKIATSPGIRVSSTSRLPAPISMMHSMSSAIAGSNVSPSGIGNFSPATPAGNAGQHVNPRKRRDRG